MPPAERTQSPQDTAEADSADERIRRAATKVYTSVVPAAEAAGDDQLLQQRIAAFFRQSGGPTSPEIPEFLDRHLRYGKDHGESGHLETIEDVFQQVVENDHSLKTMMKLYGRRQGRREQREDEERDRKADLTAAVVRLEQHIGELSKAVALLLEERAARTAGQSAAQPTGSEPT